MDSFFTIARRSEGIYKEKGSKFLSFAIPVTDAEEVKSIVASFRKEYYDARHVCYAYVLGADRTEFRANDDGEPSGTAGRPILGQIHSTNLTNILIIVVRYFGGILLGTGGLITAYKAAAADAIANNEITVQEVMIALEIEFDYLTMNDVMSLLKETDTTVTEQQFDMTCRMKLSVRQAIYPMFMGKLEKTESLRVVERD
ncbi:YigZ family protein [Paludibacter sp.]|uniref:IMPACT family protein n=1 Tax=Paludibacter sp. TaxID=1898105 RepID=UPI001353D641|nr:YigZ family protein [Paludibacter sp.]MTK52504.1 YigZ family protein [Paludibacter sp.]